MRLSWRPSGLRLPRIAAPAAAADGWSRQATRGWLATSVLGWLAAAAFTALPAHAQPAEANPPLPPVFLQAGIHRIKAEVADSQGERSRGLMLRQSLQANSGMLFVFESAAMHCFWMKNTLIPLSIAFLEEDGTIVTLADMQPHDETSHCPAKPVRYALEMDQGWFKTKGIKPGDRISGLNRP